MDFIVKRTGITLVTVFLVSAASFLLFTVLPGDPVTYLLGTEARAEQIEALREELGLDLNVARRYVKWLSDFAGGRQINSIRFHGESVSALIRDRLPVSAALALLALFFILLIAVPLSLVSARGGSFPQNSADTKRLSFRIARTADKITNALTAFGVSIPGFFLGVLFIWIFGITLKVFVPGIYIDYRENFFGFIFSLCFPALAIAIPNAAVLLKFLRAALLREMESDYARTARSKGAPFSRVLYRHALRNALVTSVTVFAMIAAEVFSGSIVIEQVFTVPGIGRLLVAAIMSRDYPLLQSLVVYIACTVVVVNMSADIAIQIIDPRIRLEHSKIREARA